MDVPLETRRLLLEPLRAEHAPELYPIYADGAAMRFWYAPPHGSVDETLRMIQGELAHAHAPSWAVRLRDEGTLIGRVNFIAAAVTGMGYLIWSPYWRRGYGTEAAAATLEHGFRSGGYDRIELWIHEGNIASQRLAAGLGFRQRGQFRQRYETSPAPFETQVWGLRAAEWAAATGARSYVSPARNIALYGIAPTIAVPDVAATAQFYVEQLGFEVDYCAGEPISFAIVGRGEWTAERAQIHLTQGAPTGLPARLYLRVSDADTLHDELVGRGTAIEQPIVTQAYGRREFGVRDPNGLLLVFAADI